MAHRRQSQVASGEISISTHPHQTATYERLPASNVLPFIVVPAARPFHDEQAAGRTAARVAESPRQQHDRPNQVESKPSVLASSKKIGAVSIRTWSMNTENRLTPIIMKDHAEVGVTFEAGAPQSMIPSRLPVKRDLREVAEPKI